MISIYVYQTQFMLKMYGTDKLYLTDIWHTATDFKYTMDTDIPTVYVKQP